MSTTAPLAIAPVLVGADVEQYVFGEDFSLNAAVDPATLGMTHVSISGSANIFNGFVKDHTDGTFSSLHETTLSTLPARRVELPTSLVRGALAPVLTRYFGVSSEVLINTVSGGIENFADLIRNSNTVNLLDTEVNDIIDDLSDLASVVRTQIESTFSVEIVNVAEGSAGSYMSVSDLHSLALSGMLTAGLYQLPDFATLVAFKDEDTSAGAARRTVDLNVALNNLGSYGDYNISRNEVLRLLRSDSFSETMADNMRNNGGADWASLKASLQLNERDGTNLVMNNRVFRQTIVVPVGDATVVTTLERALDESLLTIDESNVSYLPGTRYVTVKDYIINTLRDDKTLVIDNKSTDAIVGASSYTFTADFITARVGESPSEITAAVALDAVVAKTYAELAVPSAISYLYSLIGGFFNVDKSIITYEKFSTACTNAGGSFSAAMDTITGNYKTYVENVPVTDFEYLTYGTTGSEAIVFDISFDSEFNELAENSYKATIAKYLYGSEDTNIGELENNEELTGSYILGGRSASATIMAELNRNLSAIVLAAENIIRQNTTTDRPSDRTFDSPFLSGDELSFNMLYVNGKITIQLDEATLVDGTKNGIDFFADPVASHKVAGSDPSIVINVAGISGEGMATEGALATNRFTKDRTSGSIVSWDENQGGHVTYEKVSVEQVRRAGLLIRLKISLGA
jgi:hypothetical protein